MTKDKKFYLTTSIFYVNASPHLGHALELIQADTIARYNRLIGKDVFFLTGTDENAQKNVISAKKENISPLKFISRNAQKFKKLAKVLDISNSYFIRTTDKKIHWPGVQKLWQECQKNGDIYKKQYEGLYCVGCEAFLTKKDLVSGKCPLHQREPEKVREENYFFRLSKYKEKIKNIIQKDKVKIIPESKKNEILNILNSELEDLSISRPSERLEGIGILVPNDNSQKIYVWFDALANYISAIGYGNNSKKYKKYWPADLHLIGKDILKFHAIYWLAFLLSAKIELPRAILVHSFIKVEGQKMSKSLGNIVDPFELVQKYGKDAVRYYFLRESSPFEDVDFTFEKFEKRYNADLALGLGNLVNRIISLAQREKVKTKKGSKESLVFLKKSLKIYHQKMKEFKLNEALIEIWNLISYTDKYIEKTRPWEKNKDQKQKISNLLFLLSEISNILKPFLPETSKKIDFQVKTLNKEIVFQKI